MTDLPKRCPRAPKTEGDDTPSQGAAADRIEADAGISSGGDGSIPSGPDTPGVFVQTNTDSHMARTRLIGYVIQEDGCWEWVGCKDRRGYGRLRGEWAHRYMYERQHGPIPDGYECHHTCANRRCVNPSHLELVTSKEHYERDLGMQDGLRRARSQSIHVSLAKTHCRQGHPYAGKNLYMTPKGHRRCRECKRLWKWRYRQRKREATA